MNPGALGEYQHLASGLQAGEGLLHRLHVGVAPVHIDDPRLAQQPAHQGHPGELDLGHGPDVPAQGGGKADHQGVGQSRVVGTEHRTSLRDILPPNGADGMDQAEKGPHDPVQQVIVKSHFHRESLSLTRVRRASKLPFKSKLVVSSRAASSA